MLKKRKLIIIFVEIFRMKACILFGAVVLGLSACTFSVNQKTDKEPEYTPVNLPKEEKAKQIGFACPMKCEGDRVYTDSTRKCPVCEMDLESTAPSK